MICLLILKYLFLWFLIHFLNLCIWDFNAIIEIWQLLSSLFLIIIAWFGGEGENVEKTVGITGNAVKDDWEGMDS